MLITPLWNLKLFSAIRFLLFLEIAYGCHLSDLFLEISPKFGVLKYFLSTSDLTLNFFCIGLVNKDSSKWSVPSHNQTKCLRLFFLFFTGNSDDPSPIVLDLPNGMPPQQAFVVQLPSLSVTQKRRVMLPVYALSYFNGLKESLSM